MTPAEPSKKPCPTTLSTPFAVSADESDSGCAMASTAAESKPRADGAAAEPSDPAMKPVCSTARTPPLNGADGDGVARGSVKHITRFAGSASGFSSHTGTAAPVDPMGFVKSPEYDGSISRYSRRQLSSGVTYCMSVPISTWDTYRERRGLDAKGGSARGAASSGRTDAK